MTGTVVRASSRRRSRLGFRALLAGALLAGAAATPGTAAESPMPLRVSDNGRFLVHADGSAFFPLADTAWQIAWRLKREEVTAYLDHRKRQRFNTIAMVAFPMDGRVVPNPYGDHPFAIEQGKYDPARPLTTPGADPRRLKEYDYWDHVAFVLQAAAERGLYVILLPSWGGCVAGDWGSGKPNHEVLFDMESAYRYGYWVGGRFRDFHHLIWMLGGDRSAVYGEHDYRAIFRAMARGVANGVNGAPLREAEPDYRTTLMSFHPRKWQPNSSAWFHAEPWLDFNSIQDQPKDQVPAIRHDYALTPAKPTWLFEGGYEHRGNVYGAWQIRFQSYQTVLAGGFGVTYGNMNIYHFDAPELVEQEPGTASYRCHWRASLDDPGGAQLRHLVALMEWLGDARFRERVPDPALIAGEAGGETGGEGLHSNRLVASRGARGDYALIYSANGRDIPLRLNRLAGPRLKACWFNPRNGHWRVGETESAAPPPAAPRVPSGPGAPIHRFDPPGQPGDGNDWVLVLETPARP